MGKYKDQVNALYERYKGRVGEELASELRDYANALIDENKEELKRARIGIGVGTLASLVGLGLALPTMGMSVFAGAGVLGEAYDRSKDVEGMKKAIVSQLETDYNILARTRQSAMRDILPSAGAGGGVREVEPVDASAPPSMVRPRLPSNERVSYEPIQRGGLYSTRHTVDDMVSRLRNG
jgi:hypothetical protein